MHGTVMSMGALALSGMASAARLGPRWTYPDCEADNCYRAFIDKDHIGMAPAFCWDFLTTPHKVASGVPQEFANCDNDVKLISSACSCITYTYSHSASSSSAPPPATTTSSVTTEVLTTSSTPATTTPTGISSSAAVPSSSSSAVPVTSSSRSSSHVHHITSTSTYSHGPSASASASATPSTGATDSEVLTTSTVTKVHSYTVTSCAKTVVDCPATTKPYVTVETSVYVTTCPVSSGKPKPTPETKTYPVSSYPVGSSTSTLYATSLYTVTKCPPHVHNCTVKITGKKAMANRRVNKQPASSTYVASSVVPTGTTVVTYPVAVSTSTLYATSQITLTKCPPSVHNCPASGTYVTSTVLPTGSVVVTYPVDVPTTKKVETTAPYGVTTAPTPQQSYGYGGTGAPIAPPKPTSSYPAVPIAAAGRVEMAGVAAVVGGVLAALL
ncbi:hypothetical protein PG997_007845 [Apiospora hydei]|uniref:Uncharacterized protein n=1 Tax=Apiospora hydei TaxID=1337664 RepID=A0ABR1W965_9PEZI